MSSGIRTFANEYTDDDSGEKIGFLSITQVGRGSNKVGVQKQGVNFHIKGTDVFGKSTQTSVTLETEQIKLLVSDLINKLSGGISQDQSGADDEITEELASNVNYQTRRGVFS
ncbi:MAG: hypothetical protein KJI69_03615 [Patescibacteria group bacterium]|nr:hypothetical protein [Patescibacteria group bacterium]